MDDDVKKPLILVTGASGYVGQHLVKLLLSKNSYRIRLLLRDSYILTHPDLELIINAEPFGSDCLRAATDGVDIVIHLVAKTHDTDSKQLQDSENKLEYERVNIEYTRCLAEISSQARVKKFIFISSIKVNGEGSLEPYNELSIPAPEDLYGETKYQAEQVLLGISESSSMSICVIRPPLVVGAQAKGNLKTIKKVSSLGLPLPFLSIKNKRSVVKLNTLCEFLINCVELKANKFDIFIIAEKEPLTTAEILKLGADLDGYRLNMIPFPVSVLKVLLRAFGMGNMIKKLMGDLEVDISKVEKLL